MTSFHLYQLILGLCYRSQPGLQSSPAHRFTERHRFHLSSSPRSQALPIARRGLHSTGTCATQRAGIEQGAPISIYAIAWEGGIFAPVELKHSRGWQGLGIQGASTLN